MSGLLPSWEVKGVYLIINVVVGGDWCDKDRDSDNYGEISLPSHFHP